MGDLDAVLAQLADVQERLHELPDDAFEERARLQARRRDLEAQAGRERAEAGPAHTREALERERTELIERLGTITEAEVGRGRFDTTQAHGPLLVPDENINEEIDEGLNRAAIENRLHKVQSQLDALDDER